MSESKFNDARVLRSDETSLKLEELRMLYNNLESGEHDSASLRKLTSVGNKLEEALGDYYQKIDAAILEARRAVREGANAGITEAAVNLIINQLDAAQDQGQSLAPDIILQLNEWQWVMDRFRANKSFTGIKEIRIKWLRIEDAIVNAKGIKFMGSSKRAWVEGEPEPMHAVAEIGS